VEVTSFHLNMEWKLSSNNKYHPRKRWRCEWIRIWGMDRKTGWRTIARIAEPAKTEVSMLLLTTYTKNDAMTVEVLT